MKFGLMFPNMGSHYGNPTLLVELALCAEQAGWEGFFLWDHIGGARGWPTVDPWVCLGAIASQTRILRLGTMVTPLSRRRPWKVAREIVTLDHLSGGRAVLGVGLGDYVNKDFKAFGEVCDPQMRAAMLDESLEIIAGLQSGCPFSYNGKHYKVAETMFTPAPIQSPRIPVWVAARWPLKRPLQRAARWDGVLPIQWNAGPITPDVLREIAGYIARHRKVDSPFDLIKYGQTEGKDLVHDRARVQEYSAAGATWWVESIYAGRGTPKQIQQRIISGPPRY